MRASVRIHRPQPSTHLPAHEQAARRTRARAALPPRTASRPAAPTAAPHHPSTPAAPLGRPTITRKTADTRFPPIHR